VISIISVAEKTYALFGSGPTTVSYYLEIGMLADLALEECSDIHDLARTLQQESRKSGF
jgi:hypothetical protein